MRVVKFIFSGRIAFALIGIVLATLTGGVQGQDIVIQKNSVWKYSDTGQSPGSGWYTSNFNDNSWSSGDGIFGYGEGDEGTVISFGSDYTNKHITTYFRKTFTSADYANVKSLIIRMICDDGAVVYLNNEEILSINMPENPTNISLAIDGIGGEDERIYFVYKVPVDELKSGLNLLAVEVHQQDPLSSDLSFDMELETSTIGYGKPRINEVLPKNFSYYNDPEYNQFSDWIELYNPLPETVSLGGYYLTDNLSKPEKWRIPEGTSISSNSYLLISADGMNQGLHTNFQLAKEGERLGLFSPELELIDSLSYPPMNPNVSIGLLADGESRGYFGEPTPGEENTKGVLDAKPVTGASFSKAEGFYGAAISLELSTLEPSGTIRYTTDGSDPRENSDRYQSSISLSSTTVIKARVFVEGAMPSHIITKSYFINTHHELPVISIATNPDFISDQDVGIYREDRLPERKEWERPGTLEFFESNGDLGFWRNIDYRLFGRGAMYFPQKSLGIFIRETDTYDGLDYELFPGSPVKYFQSFILRSSSDDWRNTMFRDGMIHSLLTGKMDLEKMDYRPAVLYINGKYMGIHNIRDKLNPAYLASHKAIDPLGVDLLYVNNDLTPPNIEIKAGDDIAYWNMWQFIAENDMSDDDKYSIASSMLDIPNYQDYCVVEIITGNRSWLHNRRVWRPRTAEGKFRYMLFDTDYGYIFLDQNILNSLNITDKIFKSLMKNKEFKSEVIQKIAIYAQTIFEKSRVTAFIDNFSSAIESEIPRHAEKWGPTYSGNFKNKTEWLAKVADMRDFNSGRASRHEGYIQSYLSNAGRVNASFKNNISGAGSIQCQGVQFDNLPFNGYLYKNQNIKLKAIPASGHKFSGWIEADIDDLLVSGQTLNIVNGLILNREIIIMPSRNFSVTATFGEPAESDIIISELHYFPNGSQGGDNGEFIELFNISNNRIELTGYYFTGAITYTFPANSSIGSGEYIVVAKDVTKFQQLGNRAYDWEDGRLDNGGEQITLWNAQAQIADIVNYGIESPWPTMSSGFSISVCDLSKQNDEGANWILSSIPGGSPGEQQAIMACDKLVINEFAGLDTDQDLFGKTDWIEIYNPGFEDIDLAGLFITDDQGFPIRHQIPAGFPELTTIKAGGYLVLIADGFPEISPLNLSFKIAGSSGYLGLYSKNSDDSFTILDEVSYGSLRQGESMGREKDGIGEFVQLESPTPGSSNILLSKNIITPSRVKTGDIIPIVIRITDENGLIDKSVVRTINLAVSKGSIQPSNVLIRNGVGSVSATFSATEDFVISVSEFNYTRSVEVNSSYPTVNLSGTVYDSLYLADGVDYVINEALTIAATGKVFVNAGARILMGNKANFNSIGRMQFNGTAEKPIIISSKSSAYQWGGIWLHDIQDTSKFNYTFFTRGGADPNRVFGHSASQAVIHTYKTLATFSNCFVIDNKGKALYGVESRLFINDCLFSRSDTGPEMLDSYSVVKDSWMVDIPDTDRSQIDDDNDGIYFNRSFSVDDPPNILKGCVIFWTEDDGVDSREVELIVTDCIISKNLDKGISAGWRSDLLVEKSLFYGNNRGIASTFWTPVRVDHCTFYKNTYALYSYSGAGGFVTNSILSDYKIEYADDSSKSWYFEYSMSDSDAGLIGESNIFGSPQFKDPNAWDYSLKQESKAIDAGDPDSPRDADGSVTDLGFRSVESNSSTSLDLVISELHYNPIAGSISDEHFEFIELINGRNTSLDVSSYRIDDAIQFAFPANTILDAGEVVLLCFDKYQYAHIDCRKWQWSQGKLSNSGETISLFNAQGQLIDQVVYTDVDPWPEASDGLGYSLELTSLYADNSNASYWKSSQALGGTPGLPYQPVDYAKVKINEIQIIDSQDKYSTNSILYSWIEVYNGGINPLSLGGYRLSNSLNESLIIPDGGEISYNAGRRGHILIPLDPDELGVENGINLDPGQEIKLEKFNGTDWVVIDKLTIAEVSSSTSNGRYPDGSSSITQFRSPSPGSQNTLASPNIITPRLVMDGEYFPIVVKLDSIGDQANYVLNMDVTLSPSDGSFTDKKISLVNGQGGTVTKFDGKDAFNLGFVEIADTLGIDVPGERHIVHIDKKILFDQVWTSQHDYYVHSSVDIRQGATVTIEAGTRVFLAKNIKIVVYGAFEVKGTKLNPVLFAPIYWNEPWGNIEFPVFSQGGSFNGVFFIGGNGSGAKAIINTSGTDIDFSDCYFIENTGKAIYGKNSSISVLNSLVSETESGIEINDGSLNVDRTWFQFLPDKNALQQTDEHDAIHVSGNENQNPPSIISNSSFSTITDDAIEGLDASNLNLSYLFLDKIGDKAISTTETNAWVSYSIITNSDEGIVSKENSTIWVDHTSLYNNHSHVKAYTNNVNIGHGEVNVKNTILSDYIDLIFYADEFSNISFSYSLSNQKLLGGNGNLFVDPMFVSAENNDFRLMLGSPAIDAGDPGSPLDQDFSTTDIGAYSGRSLDEIPVIINEIMYALKQNNDGAEFIELFNYGSLDIELSGFYFSSGVTFEFPQGSFIAPNEYIVITKDASKYAGKGFQVFAWQSGDLSDSGELVKLMSQEEIPVNAVNYGVSGSWPQLANGNGPSLELIATGLNNSDAKNWQSSYVVGGTPGKENSKPVFEGIVINELMARNNTTIQNDEGEYVDWVELYNPTSNYIQLNGLYLTKYDDDLLHHKISGSDSELLLAPNEYILFWLDESVSGGTFHANFTLAGAGGYFGISKSNNSGGQVLDEVYYSSLAADITFGRIPDGTDNWTVLGNPTPGSSNAIGNTKIAGIYINEILARNSHTYLNDIGEYDDWIEIYNSTNRNIDLGGLYLSDDPTNILKFKLPTGDPLNTTVLSKGFLMLFPSAKPESSSKHLEFQLSGGGEHVSITQVFIGESIIIDSVTYPSLSIDKSYARLWDGGRVWERVEVPTPDASNGTSSIQTPIQDVSPVNVYPNPATDRVYITFSHDEPFDYQVELVSPISQTVSVISEGHNPLAFTPILLSFDIHDLGLEASSLVFIRIRINEQIFIKKTVIIH